MSTTVSYNGVTLRMCNVLAYERVPEYDGPTYLYTRHLLLVRAVYNPAATSYSGSAGGTPTATNGTFAPATDVAIHDALCRPRKLLTVTVGGAVVMTSPQLLRSLVGPLLPGDARSTARYTTDAKNGPFPVHVNVQEVIGAKTFMVEFGVETCLNECPTKRVVLSHRWKATEEITLPNYYSERQVDGHVILATDAMLNAGLQPDDFRQAVIHGLPFGYQRKNIQVVVDEDNSTLHYHFTDIQRPIALLDSIPRRFGVTDIKASHTAEIRKHPADQAIGQLGATVARAAGVAAGVGAAAFGSAGGSLWGFGIAALRSAAMGAAAFISQIPNITLTYINLVPRQVHRLAVQVWGNEDSIRSQLYAVGFDLLQNRLAQIPERSNFWGGFWFFVNNDLMDKYIELQIEYIAGLSRVFQTFQAIGENPLAVSRNLERLVNEMSALDGRFYEIMPAAEEVAGITTIRPGTWQGPSSARGTRPSLNWARATLAQSLAAECALPSDPPLDGFLPRPNNLTTTR